MFISCKSGINELGASVTRLVSEEVGWVENTSERCGFEFCILLWAALTSLTLNFLSNKIEKKFLYDKDILKYKQDNLCKLLGTYITVTNINLVRRGKMIMIEKKWWKESIGSKFYRREERVKERCLNTPRVNTDPLFHYIAVDGILIVQVTQLLNTASNLGWHYCLHGLPCLWCSFPLLPQISIRFPCRILCERRYIRASRLLCPTEILAPCRVLDALST